MTKHRLLCIQRGAGEGEGKGAGVVEVEGGGVGDDGEEEVVVASEVKIWNKNFEVV
jgi:hypothetical protein